MRERERERKEEKRGRGEKDREITKVFNGIFMNLIIA